jgi:beta-lactamase superfamily II metal-dependent hydrolase
MRFVRALIPVFLFLVVLPLAAQNLEIHYIDVGWGGSVFIKGPTGITVLLEAGNTGMGTSYVVPYLKSIGVQPANGLDYVIGGHQHCDHIGGLDEVINAGYNVHIKQYYNGSTYSSSCADGWNSASASTTAGAPIAMPVGTVIALGNGATLTCIARNGSIIGGGSVAVTDENDRSIALLIKYGGFDYLWASDLGGGPDSCTGRGTTQLDVETSVINAISPGGAHPLISAGGIDLMHVNHHGSESSTNPTYFSKAKPAVAIIGVGAGESAGWDLPRIKVVDGVLLGSSGCTTAPPTFVLQTEEGNPASTNTSHSGYCVGNIKVTTDGISIFTVSADGAVHQGPNELAASGLPRSFTIDDASGGGDTTAPTTSITTPASGATVSGTTSVTASASDNVGVTKVEFYVDGVLKSTDTTSPYSWSWDTTTATNATHSLTSKAYDAANNAGTSAAVSVTVSNTVTTQQLLGNPGFETGTASPWVASTGIIDNSTSEAAHTGSWKAWLDGYGATHTDTLYQQVTIPSTATSATLTFWLHTDTAETTTTTAYDTLKLQIRNSSGTVLATLATYSNLNKNTGYAQKSFSLTSYKGQTIQVYLVGAEDSTLQTSFVVDDFALNAQ